MIPVIKVQGVYYKYVAMQDNIGSMTRLLKVYYFNHVRGKMDYCMFPEVQDFTHVHTFDYDNN